MTAKARRRRTPLALADTSLFIALEQKRPLADLAPENIAVSVVTMAELRLGVLATDDPVARASRLETLLHADALEPIPVDRAVATAWAELRIALRAAGKRMPINDSWIAATAIAQAIPVATRDADYDDIPGLVTMRL